MNPLTAEEESLAQPAEDRWLAVFPFNDGRLFSYSGPSPVEGLKPRFPFSLSVYEYEDPQDLIKELTTFDTQFMGEALIKSGCRKERNLIYPRAWATWYGKDFAKRVIATRPVPASVTWADYAVLTFPCTKTIGRCVAYYEQDHPVASLRCCSLCSSQFDLGCDVSTLLHRSTFMCNSRNGNAAFHIFHTSCLVSWILYHEIHSLVIGTPSWLRCPECLGSGRTIKEEISEADGSTKGKVAAAREAWKTRAGVPQSNCPGVELPGVARGYAGKFEKTVRFYVAEDR